MKVWVVSEYEFHEVINIIVFSSEEKAKDYVEKRIEENDKLYKEKEPVSYKHIIGFNCEIEEKEIK